MYARVGPTGAIFHHALRCQSIQYIQLSHDMTFWKACDEQLVTVGADIIIICRIYLFGTPSVVFLASASTLFYIRRYLTDRSTSPCLPYCIQIFFLVRQKRLYVFVNHGGGADNLVYYRGADTRFGGVNANGTRPQQRKKKLGGLNGLFMTLFVLQTASSLRVTSILFGVSESTGGRAFTTWINFLREALRPMVRLPLLNEVEATAPPNFIDKGLSKVAIVLDATETPVDKVWQTDAAWATWSNYKGKSTCKVLIGITPGGPSVLYRKRSPGA